MAIFHEDIADINLNGGSLHRNFKTVSIGSGDQNANRFGMRVFRDGEPVDLSGVECQAVFQDPMGNNIALTNHGTVGGNTAYVTLPQACYNYEGRFCLAIKLIGGGVTGTMRIVDGVVNNTHTGGTVAPTGAVPTYQEVLAVYDEAIAAIEDVEEVKNAFINKSKKDSIDSEIDFTKSTIDRYISPTSNKWGANYAASCGIYKLPDRKIIAIVTANNSQNGNIAFLKTDDHVANTYPNYATGETGRRVTEPGATNIYFIPEDAEYIYVQKSNSSGTDLTPDSVIIYEVPPIVLLDNNLEDPEKAAEAKVTGDKIEAINNLTDEDLQFTVAQENRGINWKTGAAYSTNGFAITNYIYIKDYRNLLYRQIHAALAVMPTHGMAFYDENYVYITGYCSYYTADGPSGYVDNKIPVPDDAKYARFTFRKDTQTYGPFYVKGENVLKGNIQAMIGKQEPKVVDDCKWLCGLVGMTQVNNGKFNIALRMRMMCDIEWTPIRRVPKQINDDGRIIQGAFDEGITQKGIPYGAQLTYEQWIGKNISFETFLSALANPNSVMYDFSRVGTAYRQSAWYSVNCSKAVSWALNLRNTYATGAFETDPHIDKIANAGEFDATDIQIGDILEKPSYHTAIVTDLVYNTFGDLSQIEVSEAITPVCRRKRWNLYGSFESFWDKFDGYRLLRYEYADDVPPVNMESMYPYISPSIGLNYGHKSNYKNTDTIEVTILKKVSNTLIIRKNGEQVGTIDVTGYEQSAVVEYAQTNTGWYEIGFEGDEEKNYVGFCVNNNSASFDEGTNKLTFSSNESRLYMVSYASGGNRSHISDVFPTAEDIMNGYMELNVPNNADYIHATFANDYGKTIIEIAL